ncbi:hypothetical protein F5Y18DRAFT_94419 [Xylariaceae sp. FL1019]|nr:hypothetical protein F5Y18DRAFT_94419 [Xylariaceae sp. FL1019]
MSTRGNAQRPGRLISKASHDNGRVEDVLKSDEDIQLLCGFYAYSDAQNFRRVEIYSRKWPTTPEALRSMQSRETRRSLGILEDLPPEIRYLIYDFVSEPRTYEARMQSKMKLPLQPFLYMPMKSLAHACRDMRDYCMHTYRLLWYRVTYPSSAEEFGTPGSRLGSAVDNQSSKWFYDPRRDVINLHDRKISALQVFESAKIEWTEDFRVPTSMHPSGWVPRPEQKPKVSDVVMWEIPINNASISPLQGNQQVHTIFSPQKSGLQQTTWLEE